MAEPANNVRLMMSRDEMAGLQQMAKDAARYRWLRANWARIITDTSGGGVDEPRFVNAIELGAATLNSVDGDSLDKALDRCMAELKPANASFSGGAGLPAASVASDS